ncbi:MAG: hypothetical protein JW751_07295 [Polyangiaceae bacterium]|nr:hypothetical protein [Polyangiaceae bacterium]
MNRDFREFFASLNASQVEFLIVGGVAYNFHATPRATKDIDVWVRPTTSNLGAFLEALTRFGFDHGLDPESLARDARVLMLGRVPNRIDVLTRPAGVEWTSCWAHRVSAEYDGEPVSFLSLPDLIVAKRAAARPQDLADVAKLERILQREKH